MSCPLCSSHDVSVVVLREGVPIWQNCIFDSQKSATEVTRGNLEINFCNNCGFVFNNQFDSQKISYEVGYDNSQHHSPIFSEYIDKTIEELIHEKNIKNSIIVEVGCGDGYFLERMIMREEYGNIGYGFDPAYSGAETKCNGKLHFKTDFLDPENFSIEADVIICRHVVEHIPYPMQIFGLFSKLAIKEGARLFIETPAIDWIFSNNVFWDLFYEHCSYFSLDTLVLANTLSGFKTLQAKKIFEQQYLWVESSLSKDIQKPDLGYVSGLKNLKDQFVKSHDQIIEQWKESLEKLGKSGPVAIWGAGAKGMTISNLVDPNRDLIKAIVDINPNKCGKFLSGTGHPIISFEEIMDYGIKSIVLMNPNYLLEVKDLLSKKSIDVNLIASHDWQ